MEGSAVCEQLLRDHGALFAAVEAMCPGLGRETLRALFLKSRAAAPESVRLPPRVQEGVLAAMGNSRLFMDFCRKAFGRYLHHETGAGDKTAEETRVFYRFVFGEEPPADVWGEEEKGEKEKKERPSQVIDLAGDEEEEEDDHDEDEEKERGEKESVTKTDGRRRYGTRSASKKQAPAAASAPKRGSSKHGRSVARKKSKMSPTSSNEPFSIDCEVRFRRFRLQVRGSTLVSDLHALVADVEVCPPDMRRVFYLERSDGEERLLGEHERMENVWNPGHVVRVRYDRNQMRPLPAHPYTIEVRTMASKRYVLQVRGDMTTEDLKDLICAIDGIPPDHQRIVFMGRHLGDYDQLWQACVVENSLVHLVLKLRGC